MKIRVVFAALVVSLGAVASADTFRHRETGEVFYGFRTNRRAGGKLQVYHSEEKKMITIEENQYDITLDSNGRRNTIVHIPIRQAEALISKVVSDRIAQTITDAANSGTQLIVIDIDSPGGRGEYARTIASTIEQTTHCPVAAFISGGEFSGVYSAAALIALACDEIYIAPSASIGTVGPMTGAFTNEQFVSYLNLYSSDTLVAYAGYAMSLVDQESLRLIVRALVDKSVSVVEVEDINNKISFIERQNRQPTQTIVRTLAEGVSVTPSRESSAEGPLPAEIIGRVLMLSSAEAVRIGLADHTASSVEDIARARGVSDARVIQSSDINDTVRRFAAARRTIGQGLATIERLEDYAATLENQIARVEDQLRTGTVTREVSRMEPLTRRRRVDFPRRVDEFYGIDFGDTAITRNSRTRSTQSARARRQASESERVITDQPIASLDVLRSEQAVVLRNLIAEYRRVITLARRWPGGLPPELPAQTLENNMNSASALLDQIMRLPIQTYQPPTQRIPVQPPSRR
ncbi:MAG TPA: hypothetical protein ENN97_03175 [Phycisphaerales bacterium]|nr:hypothetical protein [Phycisphaerales bacterium]